MADLWLAVTTGNPRSAARLLSRRRVQAGQGGAVSRRDWQDRLWYDFVLDVRAAHRLLGSGARLDRVIVPKAYAAWVYPGACYNKIGYWHVPGARVVYREHGKERSFGIASLISWRGVWYVVHLGAVERTVVTGIVDQPAPARASPARRAAADKFRSARRIANASCRHKLRIIAQMTCAFLGRADSVARYQRWNALLDLLPGDGELTVAEAAQALGVSEATIRRDLDQLAKQQLVTRTRGGATAGHVSYDLPLRYKTARHAPEKQRIGRAAAALLAPGASVALNGGTTTSEVARALATRPDLQDGDGARPSRW